MQAELPVRAGAHRNSRFPAMDPLAHDFDALDFGDFERHVPPSAFGEVPVKLERVPSSDGLDFGLTSAQAADMLANFTEEDLLSMEMSGFPSPGTLAALRVPGGPDACLAAGVTGGAGVAASPTLTGTRTPSKRKRDVKPGQDPQAPALSQSPQPDLTGMGRGSPVSRALPPACPARRTPSNASPAVSAGLSHRSPVLSPRVPGSVPGSAGRRATPVPPQPPPLTLTRPSSSRPASAASHSTGTPCPTPSGFDDFTVCGLCRCGYKNGDKWRNVRRIHIHWYMLMESGALCHPDSKQPIMLLSEWQGKEPYKTWARAKDQRVSSHFKVFTHEQLAHAFSAKSTAMPVHKHCLHAFNFVVKARYDDLVGMTGYASGPHPDEFGSTYSKRDLEAEAVFDPDVPVPLYITNKRCFTRRRRRTAPSKRVRHRTKSGTGSGSKSASASRDSSSYYTKSTHSTVTSAARAVAAPPRPPSHRPGSTDGDVDAETRAVALGVEVLTLGSAGGTRSTRRTAGLRAAALASSPPAPVAAPPPIPTGPFSFQDPFPFAGREDNKGVMGLEYMPPAPFLAATGEEYAYPYPKDRGFSDDVFRSGEFLSAFDDAGAGATGGMPTLVDGGAVPAVVAEGEEGDEEEEEEEEEGGDDTQFLPGTRFAPYNFADNIALSVATL